MVQDITKVKKSEYHPELRIFSENIGKVIKGYCNGYFGRDDYEDKVIVYETDTAICCKYLDNDNLTVANFNSEEEKNQHIEKWMSEDF